SPILRHQLSLVRSAVDNLDWAQARSRTCQPRSWERQLRRRDKNATPWDYPQIGARRCRQGRLPNNTLNQKGSESTERKVGRTSSTKTRDCGSLSCGRRHALNLNLTDVSKRRRQAACDG